MEIGGFVHPNGRDYGGLSLSRRVLAADTDAIYPRPLAGPRTPSHIWIVKGVLFPGLYSEMQLDVGPA